MAKPIIQRFTAFDATADHTITITWSGTVASNSVFVYAASTNALVYSGSASGRLVHIIPADRLTNGSQYYVNATVTDAEGVESEVSDNYFFSCYSTPTFEFDDPPNKIQGSSVRVMVRYAQAENRQIMSYAFYLYTKSGYLLQTSETFFDNTLAYTYKGLLDNTEYYIRARGNTVDNMLVDTGMHLISVKSGNAARMSILTCDNEPKEGRIHYHTTIYRIEYHGEDDIEIYDSKADVHGKTLYYDKGFCIDGDFTFKADFEDLITDDKTPMVEIRNDKGDSVCVYLMNYDGEYRWKLIATNGNYKYMIYTDPYYFDGPISGRINFRRVNNLYQFGMTNLSAKNYSYLTDESDIDFVTNSGDGIMAID